MADGARRGLGALTEDLAARTSRRGLLARVGQAMLAGSAVGLVGRAIKPGEAEAYHFCGHIYTTGSCPHPTGLPRIDARGLPIRAKDGRPVDDLGRLVDAGGRPVGEDGRPLTDATGRPLPVATRTKVCSAAGDQFGFTPHIDGSWYRCCNGHVRKLVDCCTDGDRRINGDKALTGYCYRGRKVFCVMYFQTKVPC
ncbi:hypothetical protein [Capillimicrobium parvum]|uniref:Twin-arginine translocation signal domain-containing protein n=1 Tax=Capillimicrobium parvum TaxID=2884022 RepID=A0A9E7C2T2_9ACTN|nr:hypothetical protein [Capillimicrobium parvum]UGS38084.1 hypothetical protein DSM104329_04506 [Capillimicrobium parvum]